MIPYELYSVTSSELIFLLAFSSVKTTLYGISLAVQWLRLRLRCRGCGLIPGQELRSHMPCGQKSQNIKQKQYCNRFNEDFKNGPHTHTKKKKLKRTITLDVVAVFVFLNLFMHI